MNEKILIVDDEEPVRHMLRRMLEDATAYKVLEADCGTTGLAVDTEQNIDLVLTDLKMPDLDGLEMATQMLEYNPDRPVLMMTAYADLDSARKALQIGIYEYFIKPIDVHDLLAGISRALERRNLVLQNKAYQQELEHKVKKRTQKLQHKVEDLAARDKLLIQLLSINDPTETIGLAVKLAVKLSNAHFGVLYTQEDFLTRAAFGFGKDNEQNPAALGFSELVNTQKTLQILSHAPDALVLENVDEVRAGFGIVSVGFIPIKKEENTIAVLEISRKDTALKANELKRIESFMPYVAMAIDDCILQEALPNFDGNVEDLLTQTEKWIK